MENYQNILKAAKNLGVDVYDPGLDEALQPVPRRFWCHWLMPGDEVQYDGKGKEIQDDIGEGKCCFNHRIGLPTRKWESDEGKAEAVPVPLTRFNRRMMDNYHAHRKYSQNKCRGSGASEILTIRYMVYKYGVLPAGENRKCIIIPGTSSSLSSELGQRIKGVCDTIPHIYAVDGSRGSIRPREFRFRTGGRIILTSATPDADRGFENVGDLILEEVAHWELIDDMPVYYAAEGVYEKTRCHIVHSTTPRGRRGFYYDLIWDPEADSDYYKHVTNWREVTGIPVRRVEDLYVYGHGGIDDDTVQEIRAECVHRYGTDDAYRKWYNAFFGGGEGGIIPIEELVDVPISLLDLNAITADSRTDRSHYDQELDNQFLAGDRRALAAAVEEDWHADDLRASINLHDARIIEM